MPILVERNTETQGQYSGIGEFKSCSFVTNIVVEAGESRVQGSILSFEQDSIRHRGGVADQQ